MEIDVRELCQALGVEYDSAKSSAFYLMLVKQYRFHYEAAQHSVQSDVCLSNGHIFLPDHSEKPFTEICISCGTRR